ncbi:MAG: molecular chaperone HtpG [Candidatus Aminicenantes bacterium]|nr:molecular chaperone HtpG [Candidatus Aminicenantes bacterium]NIM84150.1 molecular chaperone HtpG [Candidatus Aminicenantes bacterium]NIN23598.1 molecular chaperone HtpG [Candidatus Aminicenantes bacterium]NIN47305.1 molecular chaperone HtpG [Candidatus Aminicenantes bacterium]NIN90234.1 molecular chaperone HtpG [Candidatus Aminicenantes bacterium]
MTDEALNKDKKTKTKPKTKKTTTKSTEAKAKKTKTKKETSTSAKETHAFQAETKELLNIMINSLYTHREIFLRELISNSSDALDKINFRSLTEPELLEDDYELKVELAIDKDAKTLTVSDNGIGMTYNEVIQNIGTIAKSGSKAFLDSIKNKDEVELIGKFGVGFYSSFMVAEKVTLTSRVAGTKEGTRWESRGDGTFTIEKVPIEKRGTEIILHLRKESYETSEPEEDFSNQYTIQNLIKKYSDYVRYPIEMDFVREQPVRDKEGKAVEGKYETVIERKTLNSQIPIWERDKKKITKDEYFQFYKHHFHDWNEYADVIHIKAEGNIEYTALLFIPTRPPSNLYEKTYRAGIHLYANHVFVMADCRDLLPDHLRFVRGLVDSPDFSLNISREILQHNEQLKIIGKSLETRVLKAMAKLLKEERKTYEEVWKEVGKAIKGGIYMSYKNKEPLQDLVMFPSSHKEDGYVTLKEYVGRMPEGQKFIYFAPGKDIEAIKRMPQLEIFREKDVEILYFVDKVDEFVTQNLDEYDGKKLMSITRQDLDLDSIIEDEKKEKDKDKKKDTEKKDEKKDEKYKELFAAMKKHLGDKVSEVRLSKRLTTSPVCLVTSNTGMTFNMEQLLRGANQIAPRAAKIMELNEKHAIFSVLQDMYEKDKNSQELKKFSELLFHQALLIEGYELDNPVEFSNLISDMMVTAYKK